MKTINEDQVDELAIMLDQINTAAESLSVCLCNAEPLRETRLARLLIHTIEHKAGKVSKILNC